MAKQLKTWVGKSRKLLLILLLIAVIYNLCAVPFGLPPIPVDSVFGSVLSVLTLIGG